MHSPDGAAVNTVVEFWSLATSVGFVMYTLVILGTLGYIMRVIAPKYGEDQPIVYISICSIVGSYLVLFVQGFGSALVYSFANWEKDNQMVHCLNTFNRPMLVST